MFCRWVRVILQVSLALIYIYCAFILLAGIFSSTDTTLHELRNVFLFR